MMRDKIFFWAFVLMCVTGIMLVLIGIDRTAKRAAAQEAKEARKKTLRERVGDLEKEVKALRTRIDSKIQRGTYRMGEIEASIREVGAKNAEQDKRLQRGKYWMVELQRNDTALLDRIIKYHPKEGGEK